jgi:hypothetical protein
MGDQTTTAPKALKNLRKKDYSRTVKEVERRKAQDDQLSTPNDSIES